MALLQPVPDQPPMVAQPALVVMSALQKTASCTMQGDAITVLVGSFYCPRPHPTARH
jgi:hypothetical protein